MSLVENLGAAMVETTAHPLYTWQQEGKELDLVFPVAAETAAESNAEIAALRLAMAACSASSGASRWLKTIPRHVHAHVHVHVIEKLESKEG